jgi:hypothetical protein
LGEKEMSAESEKSAGILDGLGQNIFASVIESIFSFFGKLFSGFLIGIIF